MLEIATDMENGAHKFGHKTISERLEDYYGKTIEKIEPSREEEINWGATVGDELL